MIWVVVNGLGAIFWAVVIRAETVPAQPCFEWAMLVATSLVWAMLMTDWFERNEP